MAKLKSTAVKVYPTAFRGPASGSTKYNPESRLNTEFNVTNLTNRVVSKDSFVIDWNSTTKIIKFNIHGYYFESNLTEFLGVGGAGVAWTNLYASIKLLPFQTSESGNTTYKAFTLVGTEDSGSTVSPSGRILDVDDAGTYIFEGVDLHQTAINPAAGSDVYELHLLSGGPSAWAIPLTSRLKFVATDVEGLPKINNDLTLDTADTVFAPITAGTLDQVLVSAGGSLAPVWENQSDLIAGKATQLETSRNLWGRPFNGTSAISGAITGTGNITPTTNNTSNIGASDNVYANVFATTFTGNLTGNVTGDVSGNAGTVTNGVYTTGDQTIGGNKTFTGTISGITPTMVGAEPANANIQAHISSTSNPHSVTKTQVGLGNVTNDAQVKKRALGSTSGNVPTWNGTSGDALNDGYSVQTTLSSSTTALVRADAIQTALNLKANLSGATFTGSVSGLTPATTSNNTTFATTAFVKNKLVDFVKYDYSPGQTLTVSTTYANTGLQITDLKTNTFYKFKVYVTYTRSSGTNVTGVNFTLINNHTGGSPNPDGTFFAVSNATPTATSLTLMGLKVISSSASDSSALQLPSLNSFVGTSFFILEGTHFTGASTSLTLQYKYTSGANVGELNINPGSYMLIEEMFI